MAKHKVSSKVTTSSVGKSEVIEEEGLQVTPNKIWKESDNILVFLMFLFKCCQEFNTGQGYQL